MWSLGKGSLYQHLYRYIYISPKYVGHTCISLCNLGLWQYLVLGNFIQKLFDYEFWSKIRCKDSKSSEIIFPDLKRPKRPTHKNFGVWKARNLWKWFLMFVLDFFVSLGLILLEKTIFGCFKAKKAIARPSMGEIQNLQFATGKFCFFRLQTSIMIYRIASLMILKSSFINNKAKSKKEV